jgi:hypothetical protein
MTVSSQLYRTDNVTWTTRLKTQGDVKGAAPVQSSAPVVVANARDGILMRCEGLRLNGLLDSFSGVVQEKASLHNQSSLSLTELSQPCLPRTLRLLSSLAAK